MFKLIEHWADKNLTCSICGSDKSVKYEVAVTDVDGKIFYIHCCNGCVGKVAQRERHV